MRCRNWLTALTLMCMVGLAIAQETTKTQEYQVKAVFLFNFTQFVDWPAEAFTDEHEPIVIGVLGDDPFGAYLDATVQGEKVNDRPLVVRRYRRVEEVDSCQVLFISESEASRLDHIVEQLKNRSILTVSDVNGFALRGGVVRFVTENHRVKLRINLDAAKAARLLISSKLLKVSSIATTETG